MCQVQITTAAAEAAMTGQLKKLTLEIEAAIGCNTKISGIVSAYHPETLGLNPHHNIYAFFNLGIQFNLYIVILMKCEKNENKQKIGSDWPF